MRKLNYVWRLLMTGVAFSLFSIGGLMITLLACPVIRLLPGDANRRRERTQWLIHKLFGVFVGFMCTVGIMRLHLKNADALAEARGALVLANHPTLIDVVVMISLMPRSDCVVKGALWNSPFLGGVVRAAGYISNAKSSEALVESCVGALQQGGALVIFPEGTRTQPGVPLRFLRGAAHIALGCEQPILPVVLSCDPPTLSKGRPWYDIPPRRFEYRLEVKSPLSVSDLIEPDLPGTLAVRRLTVALENHFALELAACGQSAH
ncbi:lysophospholipid acyltransferase family protein [Denitromonas ohlonensis]|uniref:1-acyl-sn-glycerol-3-phosphate acyltransferase n=2 Tax=Denitromonas TaxID=139331 RepID=A0A557SF44_9RHOO|nr:lysophospholipid acyltransferase family protein [Denitromonas ohlonensis]TVO64103.1 1-acyl-sn-glycerol-3-phosphate acyltransferase [Denitromonas ohlonensis]TVO76004.1 1-acyl-sn-glycerol-3-phosphate acyltransferase [Denitromonas ohlonensis]